MNKHKKMDIPPERSGSHDSRRGMHRQSGRANLYRNILAVIGAGTVLYLLITEVLMRILAWITMSVGGNG